MEYFPRVLFVLWGMWNVPPVLRKREVVALQSHEVRFSISSRKHLDFITLDKHGSIFTRSFLTINPHVKSRIRQTVCLPAMVTIALICFTPHAVVAPVDSSLSVGLSLRIGNFAISQWILLIESRLRPFPATWLQLHTSSALCHGISWLDRATRLAESKRINSFTELW